MKAAAFDYARARSTAHAVEMLAASPGSRLIAGGQSLGPVLNLRLARPGRLIDIRECAELRRYMESSDEVVYGAAITHGEIEDGAVPDPSPGWLRHAARNIAYRTIRNRGTIGGSLAHADPAADWPVVLAALGAEVWIEGPAGTRAEPLRSFIRGPFATTLGEEEVLTAVRVPRPSPAARLGYCKLSAKRGEFAQALAVVLEDPERDERRAVVGAIERPPHRGQRGRVSRDGRRRAGAPLREAAGRPRRAGPRGRARTRHSCPRAARLRSPRRRLGLPKSFRERERFGPRCRCGTRPDRAARGPSGRERKAGGRHARSPNPPYRLPSRAPPPDRDPPRLRAWSVRSLHGAHRRGSGQVLHRVRHRLRRGRGAHHRGILRRRAHERAPRRLHPPPRPPVRVLHARNARQRLGHRVPSAGRRRIADPRRAGRQSVPLHRIPGHRGGGRRRAGRLRTPRTGRFPRRAAHAGGGPDDLLALPDLLLARAHPGLARSGAFAGLSVRTVVESGTTPVIELGIVERSGEVGGLGAGIYRPPLAPFEAACAALAAGA